MAPAPFCVFFLMILVTVRGVVDEPVEDYYTYAFETLVSAVFILAGFNCYLLLQKGSSCKSAPPKRQADAEVQCDLSNSSQIENMTPAGAIFFSPHGARWHVRKDCRHLKAALKSTQLTPCQSCTA